jgi:hypothetical protein
MYSLLAWHYSTTAVPNIKLRRDVFTLCESLIWYRAQSEGGTNMVFYCSTVQQRNKVVMSQLTDSQSQHIPHTIILDVLLGWSCIVEFQLSRARRLETPVCFYIFFYSALLLPSCHHALPLCSEGYALVGSLLPSYRHYCYLCDIDMNSDIDVEHLLSIRTMWHLITWADVQYHRYVVKI